MENRNNDSEVFFSFLGREGKTDTIFVPEKALAFLLNEEVAMLGDYWWKYHKLGKFNQAEQRFDYEPLEKPEWSKDDSELTSVYIICNDTFMWGTADCEPLKFKDIRDAYEHYTKDNLYGLIVWACKKRGMKPQKPIAEAIRKQGIWDIDNMGLETNPTDPDHGE